MLWIQYFMHKLYRVNWHMNHRAVQCIICICIGIWIGLCFSLHYEVFLVSSWFNNCEPSHVDWQQQTSSIPLCWLQSNEHFNCMHHDFLICKCLVWLLKVQSEWIGRVNLWCILVKLPLAHTLPTLIENSIPNHLTEYFLSYAWCQCHHPLTFVPVRLYICILCGKYAELSTTACIICLR